MKPIAKILSVEALFLVRECLRQNLAQSGEHRIRCTNIELPVLRNQTRHPLHYRLQDWKIHSLYELGRLRGQSDCAIRNKTRNPGRDRKQSPQSVDFLVTEDQPLGVRSDWDQSTVLLDFGPHALDATDVSPHVVRHVTHVRPNLLESQERIERPITADPTILDCSISQIAPQQQD